MTINKIRQILDRYSVTVRPLPDGVSIMSAFEKVPPLEVLELVANMLDTHHAKIHAAMTAEGVDVWHPNRRPKQ